MLGGDGAPPPRAPQRRGGSIQIGGEASTTDEEAY
jgi:hypothetical protein